MLQKKKQEKKLKKNQNTKKKEIVKIKPITIKCIINN